MPRCRRRALESEACARRKGHRDDTIRCDLDGRPVLDVSAGRKKEDVTGVRERLTDCDAGEAVPLCFPHARIVADPFPVIQHVGQAPL